MSLLAKLDAVAAARKALLPEGVEVFGTPVEEVYSSTEAKIGDRRILFLLEMIPTHAHQESPRESAALVRGHDAYGNFDVDPRPQRLMGAAELAAWQRAVEIQASVLFRGAQRPPRALAGMTSGKPPSGG